MPSLHALSLLILIAAPATAVGQTTQGLARRPAASVVFAARAHGPLHGGLAEVDSLRPVPIGTYAKEGAIAGGLLGAVGVGMLAAVGCGLSEDATKSCSGSVLMGGVLGGAMGALPGAFIGGLFPKYPKNVKVVQPE